MVDQTILVQFQVNKTLVIPAINIVKIDTNAETENRMYIVHCACI